MSNDIVTRESLCFMLRDPVERHSKVQHVVGRALAVLLANQTTDERAAECTSHSNGTGFSGYDAKFGTICAEFYNRTGWLSRKMVATWVKPDRNGAPRIVKYVRQLNDAAVAKRDAKVKVAA